MVNLCRCLQKEPFAALPWGEPSIIFSIYPGITGDEAWGSGGESVAETELESLLQSLGFSCFNSLVALMLKGF